MLKKIENETASFEWDNNILIGIINCEVVDLKNAQKIVVSRQKFTKGKSFPVLIKIQGLKKTTKEARDFFVSKKACEGLLAGAICVDSVLGNTVANLFVWLSRPNVPTKIFNNEEKAKEWLRQFVVAEN